MIKLMRQLRSLSHITWTTVEEDAYSAILIVPHKMLESFHDLDERSPFLSFLACISYDYPRYVLEP